ncbi:hypothetical protein T05_8177 [Trichinella murrelli]|uniref:Uncharacterized protein n=1 Tax=Trichinella murrelli TaxID=144512 RepID=A0A0V0SWM4_9BILA|nr:hypothetical protein T05_8177 [Trichinella murrelli]
MKFILLDSSKNSVHDSIKKLHYGIEHVILHILIPNSDL